MKKLLSGNEAIAQGAIDAGATIGAAYPGTPSTETMEYFARADGVYAEWCTNEKVALEVALGASAAGARALVTMKHVGVNVAADPLFTAAYTGVGGGLVILAADDPGMYSSQNEQDSHYYAEAAHIPMLDPADSDEAYRFAKDAFALSETFDVPVLIRSSVRISHTKTPVEVGMRTYHTPKPYQTDPSKWVMMPLYAKERRIEQLKRTDALQAWVEDCPYNTITYNDSSIGVVCAGAAYQHVREALPDASIFKIGVSWPLPKKKLAEFAKNVDKVFVVEEASTYLKDAVSACGIEVSETPNDLPLYGELTPEMVSIAFGNAPRACTSIDKQIPGRPPSLCPGCPHRVVFKELSRQKAIITGDIGCYTLGALPPLKAMDSVVDMGASVSMSHGFELVLANGDNDRPVVALIGDSTFAHSGLSSLVSTAYNRGSGTICILDNRTTAMTGRQGNPFNGVTLQNRPSRELDIKRIVSALGIEHVVEVDPYDVAATRAAIKSAVNSKDTLDVLIFRRPCVLLERTKSIPYMVTSCTACGACITLGCPAIGKEEDTGMAYIDEQQCIGCGQCAQYCKFNAIVRD